MKPWYKVTLWVLAWVSLFCICLLVVSEVYATHPEPEPGCSCRHEIEELAFRIQVLQAQVKDLRGCLEASPKVCALKGPGE